MEYLKKEELIKLLQENNKVIEKLIEEQVKEYKYNSSYANIFKSIKDAVDGEDKANVLVVFDCIHKHKEFLDYVNYFKTDIDDNDYFFNNYETVFCSRGIFKISNAGAKSLSISIVCADSAEQLERNILGYNYTDLIFPDTPSYFGDGNITRISPDIESITLLQG